MRPIKFSPLSLTKTRGRACFPRSGSMRPAPCGPKGVQIPPLASPPDASHVSFSCKQFAHPAEATYCCPKIRPKNQPKNSSLLLATFCDFGTLIWPQNTPQTAFFVIFGPSFLGMCFQAPKWCFLGGQNLENHQFRLGKTTIFTKRRQSKKHHFLVYFGYQKHTKFH